MSKRTKKLDKESILVMTSLSIFYVLILFISFMFVRMMDKRNEIHMQYMAEQSFSTFFFRAKWNEMNMDEIFDETGVKGLGTYTSEGRLILGLGQVPESYIPPEEFVDPLFRKGEAEYNKETGFIEYTRRVLVTLSIGTDSLITPDILYIAIDGKAYRNTRFVLFGLYGLFSLLMTIFVLFAWRMFARSKTYRETITRQESLVSLGEAARPLAHEIKNPLSAIALQTAVLKKTLPDEADKGLRTIEEQVQRLNNLADRVREFIRNAKGNPEHIHIIDFITEIIGTFYRNIPIEKAQMDACYIEIDRERARSAFENLINNALESSIDTEPEVFVVCKSTASSISISIVDTGDGIPEGQEKTIFDPFFTTKTQGSGIGLAISRRFIESAGGTLKIRRRDLEDGALKYNQGTIAEVTLPGNRT